RPELDAPAAPPDVRVGLARVVHVAEGVPGDRPVDRRAVLELDDRDPPPAARAAPRLAQADALARHLADLAPPRQPGGGEHAAAVDRARPDLDAGGHAASHQARRAAPAAARPAGRRTVTRPGHGRPP